MELVIKRAGGLTPEERKQVDDRLLSEFGDALTAMLWAEVHWRVLVRVNGLIASQVEIIERTVSAGERDVKLGGVSGVVTLPEFRGQGLSTAALRAAASFLRDELRVPFGLLICGEAMVPFYSRLGWQRVAGPTVYDQPGGRVVSDGVTMVLPLSEAPWPEGPIDLRGLPW